MARQDKFLGAVRSLWELSLPLPVGFGTRRPPTYVGARDHRPTAFSAPRSFEDGTAERLTSAAADSKASLRKEGLARRKGLPGEARARLTERLLSEGVRLARLRNASIVSAFHSIREEPDTLALLTALANQGFTTALPAVVGPTTHLEFRLWRPGDPVLIGRMGIPEPLDSSPAVEPDLLFVPLACFDRRGHRIGYGAGYYDRSLERLRGMKDVLAVGVAYGVCEVGAVPYEAHDEPLDVILTERETIILRDL